MERSKTRATRSPKTATPPYDAATNLNSDKRIAALLEAAFEDGHPRVIAAALGAIARAKGMAKIAKDAGLNEKSLYRALSGEGNPELDTFIKVVRALGLRLHATAAA
ncbi:MAG: addiction module antidote protein [Acidobacteriota bacterium]